MTHSCRAFETAGVISLSAVKGRLHSPCDIRALPGKRQRRICSQLSSRGRTVTFGLHVFTCQWLGAEPFFAISYESKPSAAAPCSSLDRVSLFRTTGYHQRKFTLRRHMNSVSDAAANSKPGFDRAECSTPPGKSVATIPLLDENGDAILFDMYIDGVWHGSRRTLPQCESYFKFLGEGPN